LQTLIAGFTDIVSTANSLATQIGAGSAKRRDAVEIRQSDAAIADAFREVSETP
jgi:hypothetical protein